MSNQLFNVDPQAARLTLVEKHIRCENAHDLEGILQTFGSQALYDDEAWAEHHQGRAQVRQYYAQLIQAMPDLSIAVQHYHATAEAILVEVIVRGTHLGTWRGLPASGRRIEFPLCGVFSFGPDNLLAGERIYYDRATVLRQLGVFHEPETRTGQFAIVATHPLTMAKTLVRTLFHR